MSSDTQRLLLQAENHVARPVYAHLMAYCPTMDMLAVVTEDEELEVYRLNGQLAFSRKRRGGKAKVDSICWKFNGKSIVVAWDDLTIEVISTETGKPVVWEQHQEAQSSSELSDRRVLCLAWAFSFIDVPSVKARASGAADTTSNGIIDDWAEKENGVSINDVLQGMQDLKILDAVPGLPAQIAQMDPGRLLPKLSPIPSAPAGPLGRPTQTVPDVFASQSSIDAMFHSQHLDFNNAVETLLLCHANGEISPTMYNSLELAPTKLPEGWIFKAQSQVFQSSHPYSRSHCLLADIGKKKAPSSAIKGGGSPGDELPVHYKLTFVPLTFRFMASSGFKVHLVGAKQQQLANLLRYVQECIRSVSSYWFHSQDLPARFMRNIDDTLEEKKEGTLVTNLFHLAVTGHCPATIKEWLVDELTESGHKRWDHASALGYSKLVELVHENLLPALDRCSIIITSLRGLAQYDDSSTLFDVQVRVFTVILDILRCLRLLAHYILQYAAEARRQFSIFSKWLRHQIDVQATDPSSASAEEMLQKDLGINYAQLLAFIEGGLGNSHISPFLRRNLNLSEASTLRGKTPPAYEDLAKILQKHKEGVSNQTEEVDVWTMFLHLHINCRTVFSATARWQTSNTTLGGGLVLEDEELTQARDITTIFENLPGSNNLTTYVAAVPKSRPNEVRLHCIVHHDAIDNIATSIETLSALTVKLPLNGTILDIKFADNEQILVLWTANATATSRSPSSANSHFSESAVLLSLPYNGSPSASSTAKPVVSYESSTDMTNITGIVFPDGKAGTDRPVWDLTNPESIDTHGYVRHVFPFKDKFVPLKLEVNGREHRRVVVVLEERSRAYKVLDLDYMEGHEMDKDGWA